MKKKVVHLLVRQTGLLRYWWGKCGVMMDSQQRWDKVQEQFTTDAGKVTCAKCQATQAKKEVEP